MQRLDYHSVLACFLFPQSDLALEMMTPRKGMLVLLCAVMVVTCSAVPPWYSQLRDNFVSEERSRRLGSDLVLNPRERLVNRFLMNLKQEMIKDSTHCNTPFPLARHFFYSKPAIDNSTVFQVIKMMPKGGVLHLHMTTLTSLEKVVSKLTYLPDLYAKVDLPSRTWHFRFSNVTLGDDWLPMTVCRSNAPDVQAFDKSLAEDMSLWVDDPYKAYPTINEVWSRFQQFFATQNGLINSVARLKTYFTEGLMEFLEDNVQYMELRSYFMKDQNGNDITEDYLAMLHSLVKEIQTQHPEFIGVRIIMAGNRNSTEEDVKRDIAATLALMEKYPDFIKGFDLDNWEDRVNRLLDFMDELLGPAEEHKTLPYFFHAGETDWNQGADMNLVDAVLLNASRIGHGFAILKHPKVLETIIERQVAIEINPLSNQVLGLIGDLRNHPGATLIAQGAPMVISSDNPTPYFASPQSHDFYLTFLGLAGQDDDLRLLKQLAINSFKYSTMTDSEKAEGLRMWEIKWDRFIEDVISTYQLCASGQTIIG